MARVDLADVPRATYRLQFGPDFTFADATELVPYLDGLGVSHVYASPFLKARAGSQHGYDITDHTVLNPELGDDADFDRFVAALKARGMGLIADFVPNHMGIGKSDSAWWLDVLEWGRSSPFAAYFDIDWTPAKTELRNKVLVPFLGDHYGNTLEAGDLALRFDPTEGSFSVWYHEHRFPIAIRHYGRVLAEGLARPGGREQADNGTREIVRQFVSQCGSIPTGEIAQRNRPRIRGFARELQKRCAELFGTDPDFAACVNRAIGRLNGVPGQADTFMPLHRLLQRQHYRLSFWRVAAHEINYRRFFDINELAAIRIEMPELFERVHRRLFKWIAEGKIQGIRVDHIDGLFDPLQYCARLQEGARRARGIVPDAPDSPFYVLVEKILAQHEYLREEWPVAGTTGYEVANLLNGLFVDPEAIRRLDRFYRQFTGMTASFENTLYQCKRLITEEALAGELNVLANDLDRIAESSWRTRDFTLNGLRAALAEVVAAFPVYRTYVTRRGVVTDDRRDIDWAIARARANNPRMDEGAFNFIRDVLTTDLVRRTGSGYSRQQVIRFAMKFQQLTAPVMAKSLEDTSFYRYHRLDSLNEVGGDPGGSGTSVAAFHHANRERARRWPNAMLMTSSHDTKRGEDARLRIDLISEFPEEWPARVRRWSVLNRSKKANLDGEAAPVRNDEYLLYQTLLGAWPAAWQEVGDVDAGDMEFFVERIRRYMTKALREGKQKSSWSAPNLAYEEAVGNFVTGILSAPSSDPFLADFCGFARRMSWFTMLNALSQTVLKLTVPGVPDIYQGAELWDFDLVDPDNRRPVDWEGRRQGLARLSGTAECQAERRSDALARVLHAWTDGGIKQLLIRELLALRRRKPALFALGDYVPVSVTGDRHEKVCAFIRSHGRDAVLVVVSVLSSRIYDGADQRFPFSEPWDGTYVILPPDWADGMLRSALTGRDIEREARKTPEGECVVSISSLFREAPFAVLEAEIDDSTARAASAS